PTNEGTPQGGIISPLLANITLHGMEERLNEWVRTWKGQKRVNLQSFSFVRYADDFVCLHESEEVIQQAQEIIQNFLKPIGLIIKEEKTKIIHSFDGFDFLGFNIRQYKSGKHNSGKLSNGKPLGFKTLVKPSKKAIKKHYEDIANLIREKKAVSQDTLIHLLNPKIRGWANYYKAVCSKETFSQLDSLIFTILHKWTLRRHPNKGKKWVKNKYWKSAIYIQNGVIHSRNWMFRSNNGNELRLHSNEAIQRHIKVKGDKSPYDGDYIYWGKRLSKSIELSTKQQKLLKKQKGLCPQCNRQFITGDIMEIDHIIPKSKGGKETYQNLQLIHAHCHDQKTRTDGSLNQRYSR
ncbi:MAG: group II intron reverse transcriptase/maturase, partial [Okeania sp. SIO2H7]|nr:group II intron reverse transcriptase/maturase [Okeania sp. SIO2H7]